MIDMFNCLESPKWWEVDDVVMNAIAKLKIYSMKGFQHVIISMEQRIITKIDVIDFHFNNVLQIKISLQRIDSNKYIQKKRWH